MTNAEKFFERIKDKKVAFIGIGVSHTDVIRQFAEKGIYTEARDKTDREKLGETDNKHNGSIFYINDKVIFFIINSPLEKL